MENQPAISLKNIPHFTDCIKWNEDGLLAVCLDAHVHIITPILVSLSSKEESYKHVGFSLPEYKDTLKNTIITNTDEVQTSFLNDEGFRCANWSQAGVSPSQSCFLVVVTTKHRVFLYQCSTKDPLNSDWQMYANLTDSIKENAINHEHPTKINPHHTLYANWSKKLIADPLATKPCLLALSNKAGDICIWTVGTNGVEYACTISPHTSYVNLIEWTSWRKGSEENTHIAYIVSSCTDGTVALSFVKVKSRIHNNNDSKTTMIQDIQTNILYTWFTDEPAVTTLIKLYDDLIENDNDNDDSPFIRIAISKGITVYFLSLTMVNESITVDRDWIPCDLKNSAMGLTGGSWINVFDFRCYTVEGEGIQYHLNAEGEIQLDQHVHDNLNSSLIQKYKQQWMEEQTKAEDDDILGASDAIPYLWGTADGINHIFTAIFFSIRPAVDIHYRPESAEDAYLTFILQRSRGLDVDALIEDIDTYVNNPDFFFVKPVKGLIREVLEYLVEDEYSGPLDKWLGKLTDYMEPGPILDDRDLTKAIYCESSTIASRIIYNAQIAMKNYRIISYEDQLKTIATKAKEKTMSHFLAYIFNFVLRLPDTQFAEFSEQDKMVLLLLSDFAISLAEKPLIQQTLEVYMKLQDKFPELSLYPEIAYTSAPEGPFKPKAREKCPVCDQLVESIGGGTIAQCAAGHFWELCSITRRVLYAPNTRKCVSCGAKSLQPSNNDHHSLTDIILNHCCRCIYCGAGLLSS